MCHIKTPNVGLVGHVRTLYILLMGSSSMPQESPQLSLSSLDGLVCLFGSESKLCFICVKNKNI